MTPHDPPRAPVLMVQGTASSVGKSIVTTALCRAYRRRGLRVAPFKAQNMALNSFVCPDGGEIGRAQAVQAEAAECIPTVDMNPVLLKPEAEAASQVVVLGKVVGTMNAVQYHAYKPELRSIIDACLGRLRRAYDLVILEGAGSPAEINLKANDIVNMDVARRAGAPVLLVGDIDRGGVFAAFVGTLELLEPEERALVAGFVINKFRGDRSLLTSGIDFLSARTGVPTLGVLPHLPSLRVADEDSLALDDRRPAAAQDGKLDVVVLRFPRVSNFDDVAPLEHEPGVRLRFVESPTDVREADLVILPGSKSTASDLAWVKRHGFAEALHARARAGAPILGICGGCQMLGKTIDDPEGVESTDGRVEGLGLLPLRTVFRRRKVTAQVRARPMSRSFFEVPNTVEFGGYEIHMGEVEGLEGFAPAFEILQRNGEPTGVLDGAVAFGGKVVGTLIHGLLDDDRVRAHLLDALRIRKGLPARGTGAPTRRAAEYDRLADMVEAHLDMPRLDAILARQTSSD